MKAKRASGFVPISQPVNVAGSVALTVNLEFAHLAPQSDAITATADVRDLNIQNPDPAQRVLVRDEILDANPGHPGAPVSIPGLPIETASSGIKAPQYFAPGVAGDHGEPIATFIQVGSFLAPNNLSANAHGNGYSDPNILVPAIVGLPRRRLERWLEMARCRGVLRQWLPRYSGTSPTVQSQRSEGMELGRAYAYGTLHRLLWPVENSRIGAD